MHRNGILRGVFLCTVGQCEDEIGDERGDEETAAEKADLSSQDQGGADQRADDEGGPVAAEFMRLHDDRRQRRRPAEDQEDIGDVAADHVADGNPRRAGKGGLKAGHEFRRGGAEAHQRHADDHGRDAEPFGDGDRSAHQCFAAEKEAHEPHQNEEDAHGLILFDDWQMGVRRAVARARRGNIFAGLSPSGRDGSGWLLQR